MSRRITRTVGGALTVALALSASSCGSTQSAPSVRHAPVGAPYRYVAVGGTDASGGGSDDPFLDAWPQQLFRTSMPLSAVLVNASVPNETVAQARIVQVPTALALSPTVVTVWLVSGDLLAGTPPVTFGSELLALLTELRGRGRTTVLVGTAPTLDQVPGYRACRDGTRTRRLQCPVALPDRATLEVRLAAYNTAVTAAAASTGAVVVDVQTSVARSVAAGTAPFLDATGADLSTAGSTVVAGAFGATLHATLHPALSPATGSGG
jgi:hypothetical protein